MKLLDACALLEDFFHLTDGMFERIEEAGSVRRQRPEPKDIDLVAIPAYMPVLDLFDEPTDELVFVFGLWVSEHADEEGPSETVRYIRRGDDVPHIRKIVPFYWRGARIEVYVATPENFAILWLIRTGPWEQNQALAVRAKKMGKSLSYNQGLVDLKTRHVQIFQSEEEVYAALGLPYCFPENRDHRDWIKLIQSNRRTSGIWVPGGDGHEEELGLMAEAERKRTARRLALTPEERKAQAEKDLADLGFSL